MRRGGGAGRQPEGSQQAAQTAAALEDSGILVQETTLSPRYVRSVRMLLTCQRKLSP